MTAIVDEKEQMYGEVFDDYSSRNDRRDILVSVFQNQLEGHGLGEAKTVLSIGPGVGEVDCRILSSVMPGCTHYYAVEPDVYSVKCLRNNLQTMCPDIQHEISCVDAEAWSGPSEKFDVIFLLDVLYYVRNRPEFLRTCLDQYLNPDGQVFVVVDSHTGISARLANYIGAYNNGHDYEQKKFLEDLKKTDLNQTIFTSISFGFSTDVSHVTEQMVSHHIQRPASDQEVADVTAFLEATFPSGVAEETEWLTVLSPKSTNPNVQ